MNEFEKQFLECLQKTRLRTRVSAWVEMDENMHSVIKTSVTVCADFPDGDGGTIEVELQTAKD